MTTARGPHEAGQAAVELIVLLPLLVAIVLGVAQLLALGAASEIAGHAAEAGAVAALQGRDPIAAARAAAPGWSRARMTVSLAGGRVRVRLRPRSPWPVLAAPMTIARVADVGPSP